MEIINAKTAAAIAKKANDAAREAVLARAEFCLRELVMPVIAESAEEGKNHVFLVIPNRGDLYTSRNLVAGFLRDLGYEVSMENGKDLRIKW